MISTNDFFELQKLVWFYTYIIDEQCYSQTLEVFTHDFVFDATAVGGPRTQGMADTVAYWRSAPAESILHHASNILVREQADGTARVSSRSLVILRSGAVSPAVYEDVARRTLQGWRIAERCVSVRGTDFMPTES
jgi:hypothetical protein